MKYINKRNKIKDFLDHKNIWFSRFYIINIYNDSADHCVSYDAREIFDYNNCINYFNFLLANIACSVSNIEYIKKYKLLFIETRVNYLVEKYGIFY